MKKNRIITFTCSVCISLLGAQAAKGFQHDSIASRRAAIVRLYEQKLAALTQRYAFHTPEDSLAIPCPYFYKFFTPPVLYKEPIKDALSIQWTNVPVSRKSILAPFNFDDEDHDADLNNAINHTLVSTYVHHPEYIEQTQADLMKETPIREDVSTPIKQNVKLTEVVEKSEPVPTIEDMNIVVRRPNFWSFGGNYSMQMTQVYYSDNWYKGGDNYSSLLASITMDANYNNKQKIRWDNRLEMRLGFQTTQGDKEHKFKTYNDLLRLTNKLGLQASSHWYYSISSLSYTQFTRLYKNNDKKVYSDFMSPFNLVLSLGMEYKLNLKRFNMTANLNPIAYNFRYVDRQALSTSYGLKERHSTYNHFGPNIQANATWNISNNISWNSRFYWFSDLSSNVFEWENTFNFKITKLLSSKLYLYPRIDDSSKNYKNDKDRYFMLQELLSIGFDYSF
jgi:hypothetical protein